MKKAVLKVSKEFECDVFVCGGGTAGIAAAINAARNGAKVILADNNGYLGGTATAGMIGTFMTCMDVSGENQIIRGFFSEFVDEMIKEGGAISYLNCRGNDSYSGYRDKGHIGVTPYDYECFKRVAEKMCIKAGVKLIYNATLVGCDAENGKVKCAYLGLKDGIYCINSKVFVDTTGDGALSYFAGAKWEYGNENGEIQASSLFYTISGVDKELLDKHMKDSKDMRDKFYMDEIVEAREKGEFPCGTYKLRIYELPNGNWSVNMTQTDEQINVVDGEAVTEAEISQREQIPAITEFLRKYIPALKNIKILTSADALGIRESRRIVGDYVLKKEDMVKSTHFDDVIAVCSNFVDIHLKSRVEYIARESNDNYYIPLRSLIVKDFSNLMVAGRCASADHYVMAAIRVMPPCFAMGEAAGICAAFASKGNVSVRDVKASRVQAKILENGGYLE